MLKRLAAASALALAAATSGAASGQDRIVLPSGWLLQPAVGAMTQTDTMPQGAAASPDEKTLAVVNAGYNRPTLRLYRVTDLEQTASIPLPGAFGRPLWLDATHVLVAGANADALLNVDVSTQTVRSIPMPAHSYPVAVAKSGDTFAVATDGDMSVRIGSLDDVHAAKPTHVGGHIGGLAFSPSGTLYASNSSSSSVAVVDPQTLAVTRLATRLHPTAILARKDAIYVAETDADTVGVYDPATRSRLASIYVGDLPAAMKLDGVSPNALSQHGDTVFASLGAANTIAVIRNRTVVDRLAAGWYPTDVVPIGDRLYIIDGKGEGSSPNPYFRPHSKSDYEYIATLEYGSIRTHDLHAAAGPNAQGAIGWQAHDDGPIVRAGGPIKHVFFILKENRTYDQVLGDMPQGNGDAKLTWFGAKVTPNEHALASRYGLFDNCYTSGEVSEAGHFWADAAFANDYTERTWPSTYANRDDADDNLSGIGTPIPQNGYIWRSAAAAHVYVRVYGESSAVPTPFGPASNPDKKLQAMTDARYKGWDLDYSDLGRVGEWKREFDGFVKNGNVPQLEYIWLPNDHTYGSKAGKLTPVSYAAQNDYAVGRMVDAISHSPIWKSSAIFITEDDAQDGADHVSDQRTTCFLISPYSRGGLAHAHYATVSILRTMALMLGLKPLSIYDATAVPMSAALAAGARMGPFEAIAPKVSITARNSPKAYGAKVSSTLDFTHPDAIGGKTLLRILAHNHQGVVPSEGAKQPSHS
ncbi:MAG TPA: alkaline phosphatase family protein [Candidatus Acidoferrales bacterium]|nr:alkaline phosphatase family protein [Candidatus Acidoferrales bacterium]